MTALDKNFTRRLIEGVEGISSLPPKEDRDIDRCAGRTSACRGHAKWGRGQICAEYRRTLFFASMADTEVDIA